MPTDYMVCKPSQAIDATMIAIQEDQPILWWGSHGIGKSEIIAQIAVKLNRDIVQLRGSTIDAVDLRGLPAIDHGQTVWKRPEFIPQQGPRPGTMFLDEINRATGMVLNGLLELVLDRRVGPHKLAGNYAIVAAANPSGGGVTKLHDALSSRFTHLVLEPDLAEWCQWAASPVGDVAPVVIAFLRNFPQHFYDPAKTDRTGGPNPRAWGKKISAFVKRNPATSTLMPLVCGTVGNGPGMDFMAFLDLWIKLFQSFSIDSIISNPTQAKVHTGVSELYAVSTALARRATLQNWTRIMQYVERIPISFGACVVRDAVAMNDALAVTPETTRWYSTNPQLV